MRFTPLILAAALSGATAPAFAAPLPQSPALNAAQIPRGAIPRQLSPAEREGYRRVFASIRAADWSAAAARLDAMPEGLLHSFARAELYLAKGSPKVELDSLLALIGKASDLPQMSRLAQLARARGAAALPELPVARDLVRLPGASRRQSARATRSDVVAAALAAEMTPLIRGDRPSDAEALLDSRQYGLTEEARTEWRQRVAWAYYLAGDDDSARRQAAEARRGTGEWTVQADWVEGLAAWRQRDCNAAADAFSSVAVRARDSEMTAAGLFWAARADMACGRPEKVQARLRSASRLPETFYGLLAGGALGQVQPAVERGPAFIQADWTTISKRPNARVAAALVEIDEPAFADMLLKHQARIGAVQDHEALFHFAAKLDLPATQIWLAQNGPAGARMPVEARYPSPGWTPQGGWRVDRSLVFAHALQESQFRSDAVSPAGARGLMQLMPGTAQLIAKRRGQPVDQNVLNDPAHNFEFGQSYLQELAGFSATGGLLPKVIAAYNAGPMSVANWNTRGRNLNDPLLFIESIPFAETRAYVAIVLRNYWMYQRQSGARPDSLKAMAQGMWPRFPGLPGQTAVRLDALGRTASAD